MSEEEEKAFKLLSEIASKLHGDIVFLTAADRRYLVKVANYRRTDRDRSAHGAEWRNDARLLEFGFIAEVVVKHVGCSLGDRKITRAGLKVLPAVIDALDRPDALQVYREAK